MNLKGGGGKCRLPRTHTQLLESKEPVREVLEDGMGCLRERRYLIFSLSWTAEVQAGIHRRCLSRYKPTSKKSQAKDSVPIRKALKPPQTQQKGNCTRYTKAGRRPQAANLR